MYTEQMYKDSLAHHGILGQKWGVLNGPPYPLSYQSHSRIEQKKNSTSRIDGISKHNKPKSSDNRLVRENKKNSKNNVQTIKSKSTVKTSSKSSSTKSNTKTENKKQLTEKQKKVLKGVAIGAGIAAVAGLSAYAYHKNPAVRDAVNKLVEKSKNRSISSLNSSFNTEFTDELASKGVKIQDNFIKHKGLRTGMDYVNDIKVSNMGSKAKVFGRNHNYWKNAVNVEFRARGADTVSQISSGLNSDNPTTVAKSLFKAFNMDRKEAGEIASMMSKNMEPSDLFKNLESQPPGSRGIIGARMMGGGPHDYHFFNYRIAENGQIRFLDGYGDVMYGKINFTNDPTSTKGLFQTNGILYFRTDNRNMNIDLITKEIVQNNDGQHYSKSAMNKAKKIIKDIKAHGSDPEYINKTYGDLIVGDLVREYTDKDTGKITQDIKYGVNSLYGLKKK